MNALWNLNATPDVFNVETTINALLMTIIGGVGTLVGPMLGAGVLQLLGYWLNDIFGPRWPLLIGVVYILLVLFLPYGIVGTWQMRRNDIRAGWRRLLAAAADGDRIRPSAQELAVRGCHICVRHPSSPLEQCRTRRDQG